MQPRFPNGERESERKRFPLQTSSRPPHGSGSENTFRGRWRFLAPFSLASPCFRLRPTQHWQPPSPAALALLLPNASEDTPRPRAGPVREGELRGNSSILHELFLTTFQRVCAIKQESVFSRREEQLAGPSFSSCIVSFREKTARDSLFRLRKGS